MSSVDLLLPVYHMLTVKWRTVVTLLLRMYVLSLSDIIMNYYIFLLILVVRAKDKF